MKLIVTFIDVICGLEKLNKEKKNKNCVLSFLFIVVPKI